MCPLAQDQVAALERAARDVDRMMEARALERRHSKTADWSLFEAVAVQGVPVRQAARAVGLKRGHVRLALGRVREELGRRAAPPVEQPALQLYPPRSWEDNGLR